MMGYQSKKIITAILSSKMYCVFPNIEGKSEELPEHVYPKTMTTHQNQWRQTQFFTSIKLFLIDQMKLYI